MAFWLYAATAALTLIVALVAADITGVFNSKNHFDVDGKTVLITGGSQGMGRGVAKLLSSKGANIVIVARDETKLASALKEIKSAAKNPSHQRFHTISADLTQEPETQRILHETTHWNSNTPPQVIWTIAGVAWPQLFASTPTSTLHQMMDLNYWAPVYLAQAAMKAWLALDPATAEPKHFILTSSTACFVSVAGYAGYAPTKAAVRSLADALRSETNLYRGALASGKPGADIRVRCVVPGTIDSPGLANENREKHAITKILEKDDPVQSEDEVAAKAVQGLERGGYMVTTQWFGMLMKGSMGGGSPRDSWVVETVVAWVTAVAWLFIAPDMERTVFKYGKEHGIASVESG
ncbi:hypothetical protein MBLNU230_g1190t1 [Neophaeotheca triangularis]